MNPRSFALLLFLVFLPQLLCAHDLYVGSQKCSKCHPDIYESWLGSGHHKQLRKIVNGEGVPGLTPPPSYTWEDIAYVVGGLKVKAHFIDKKGYLITSAKDGSPAATEYNIPDNDWHDFYPGQKKPYDCAPCHTTAYKPEGQQQGLPGIVGIWHEEGIGCEACHGPGLDHTKNPNIRTVRRARSQELCERCHQRGGIDQRPLDEIGLVRHHEQINELNAGAHKGLSCFNCHSPHATAKGTKYNCIICHSRANAGYEQSVHGQAQIKCIECHMARVPVSAISRTSYVGSVRSHLFSISVNLDEDMFKEVEEKGKKSVFTKNFIAVEYACLQCHGAQGKEWAISHAVNFHQRHKAQ